MEMGFVFGATPVGSQQLRAKQCFSSARQVQRRRSTVRASLNEVYESCKNRSQEDLRLLSTHAGAALVAFALASGAGLPALAEIPESIPSTYFLDDAQVVQKANGGYIEKALNKLAENKGIKVHFVITRNFPKVEGDLKDYNLAQETFGEWNCGPKDVVVLASTKLARASIYAGSEAASLLTPEIAESIGAETFPFKARDEAYSAAVSDVSNRLVAVLNGKEDPGPPEILRETGEGTFKTKESTSKQRNKYTTVVVALLVASFIIPMVQYYWYVKDD